MAKLCQALLVALLAILLAIYFGTSFFHGPSCPLPEDIQTDYVKANFDLHKFQGVWYEAAFQDWTQASCLCGCMRSVKHYRPENEQLHDNLTLQCLRIQYFGNITSHLSESVGQMISHWNLGIIQMIDIPNTIVALGVDEETGEYNWVIEYQCVQVWKQVLFAGIQVYHRRKIVDSEELQSIIAVARQQGLGHWLDYGLGTTIINHRGCTYPFIDEEVVRRLNLKEGVT